MTPQAWVILLLILALGFTARTFKLSSAVFWHDEICSMEYAAGYGPMHYVLPADQIIHPPLLTSPQKDKSAISIWGSMSEDVHPPLYYLLLRIWLDVIGWSNTSATMLSVILSMAAMSVFFDLVRRLHGTTTALWAAAIFAFAGFQLEYARDARAYVLLMFSILLATHTLIRIEQSGFRWSRGALLAGSLCAAFLSHYYASFAIAGLAAYTLLHFRRRQLLKVAGSFACAGLFLLVTWLPHLLRQTQSVGKYSAWMHANDPTFLNVLKNWLLLPSRFIGPSGEALTAQAIAGIVFLVPLCFLHRDRSWRLWALTLWVPTLAILLLDWLNGWEQLNMPRYAITASPAVYAIVCAIPTRLWITNTTRSIALFMAVSSFAFAVWPYHYPDLDWRGGGQYLDKHAAKDDVIVYAGADMISALNNPRAMLLCFGHYYTTARPAVILDHPASQDLEAELRKRPHVWLAAFGRDPADTLPGWKVVQSFGTRSVSAGMIYKMEPIR